MDGASTDSIPVDAFRKMGYEKNVVILTRDAAYRKKLALRFLPKIVYRRYPAFIKALSDRHIVYNRTVKKILKLEEQGKIFVIRPEHPLNIGRMEKDVKNVKRVYETGYADAIKQIEELKKWFMKV